MNTLTQNLQNVLERIDKAKKISSFDEDIKLIAVSKTVTSVQIENLYSVGCSSFGENRVQALKEKAGELSHLNIEWHFIGRLQTNKINQLIDLNPYLIHSCDSLELALELNKRAEIKNKKLNILLQINSAYETSKTGVDPKNALAIYDEISRNCPYLNPKGVMSIGAHSENIDDIRKSFEITRKIYERVVPLGAKYCSMGMSGDFETAIECGSNMLRLGSILFA